VTLVSGAWRAGLAQVGQHGNLATLNLMRLHRIADVGLHHVANISRLQQQERKKRS